MPSDRRLPDQESSPARTTSSSVEPGDDREPVTAAPEESMIDAADAEHNDEPSYRDETSSAVGDQLDALLAAAAADTRDREELYLALVASEAQRDEYLDDVRRARAEFDNYRRRTAKDLSTQREAGKADLAAALLEVLDDLDRTEQAAGGSGDEQLAQGVALVATKLRATLQRAGLERIDATGVAFDPQLHEAVAQRPASADQPSSDGPIVVEVMRAGYRWGERILRAAMVTVEQ